jgi:hypothetical protein
MQPIAAYYVFVANEEARNAEFRHRRYASVPPKRSGRSRVATALNAVVRPVRRHHAGAAA